MPFDFGTPRLSGAICEFDLRQIGIEIALRHLWKAGEHRIARALAHHDFERFLKARMTLRRAQARGCQPFAQHFAKPLIEPQRGIAGAKQFAPLDWSARPCKPSDSAIKRRGGTVVARQHPVVGLGQGGEDIAPVASNPAVGFRLAEQRIGAIDCHGQYSSSGRTVSRQACSSGAVKASRSPGNAAALSTHSRRPGPPLITSIASRSNSYS